MADDRIDVMWDRLREQFGVCGHCGKKKCAGRKQHETIPEGTRIPVEAIEAASSEPSAGTLGTGEVSSTPPWETPEAREWSCHWTSAWEPLACPGLDGGEHNKYCDSLTYHVTRKLWARDRIAFLSATPPSPPTSKPGVEMELVPHCGACGHVAHGDRCLAPCICAGVIPASKEELRVAAPYVPSQEDIDDLRRNFERYRWVFVSSPLLRYLYGLLPMRETNSAPTEEPGS